MRIRTLVLVLLGCVAVAGRGVAGPKWELGDDSYMKMSFLGQAQATYSKDADPETDAYLRRARIILSGQIMDGVEFFAETDNDNAGKYGAKDSSTDIQDVFLDVRLGDSAHWAKAGLILLPFSFETRASAGSLLGLDYNSEAVKLVNTFVWRDYGAEMHGYFLNKRVSYCAGVFDGYDSEGSTKNPGADPRYTGHVAVNLVGEAETGWFYNQSRPGRAGNYLSIGAGVDIQDKATQLKGTAEMPGEVVDSQAWVADFQSGFQVGAVDLTVNGGWYVWDNSAFDGDTAFVEAGAMLNKTMLTGKYSLQQPDEGDDVADYTVGTHYFLKGHNARVGLEYRWGDSADVWLAGVSFLL